MLSLMNARVCCGLTGKRTIVRRLTSAARWFAPGAILLLVPKCPLCIAACVAAATGFGLSFSTAAYLRSSLIVLCIGFLLFFALGQARKILNL